jgi:AraC-like DNA-binding protein
LVNQIIDRIIADRSITRVDELVTQIGLNKRALQRLFNQYVGISPKWVIQRYRLQDAADQLIKQEITDCTDMALRLGYFDLAHFIKDFKTVVGLSPAEYARRANLNP